MNSNLKRSFGNKFMANGVFISRAVHVNCGIMRPGEGLPRKNSRLCLCM